jgi:cytochrome c-type biogenesis protein CcmH
MKSSGGLGPSGAARVRVTAPAGSRGGALGLLVIILLAGPALAISDPKEMLQDPKQEARAEGIGSQLRCLVCQNESIEDSGADLARDLRAIVRQRVVAGDSDQQVIDWMVARYGNFVRLKPPLTISTALLWATPGLGLLLGGLAAWWGRRRSVENAAPAPLSAAEEARLRELTGAP